MRSTLLPRVYLRKRLWASLFWIFLRWFGSLISAQSSDLDLDDSLPDPDDPALEDIACCSLPCCCDDMLLSATKLSSLAKVAVKLDRVRGWKGWVVIRETFNYED